MDSLLEDSVEKNRHPKLSLFNDWDDMTWLTAISEARIFQSRRSFSEFLLNYYESDFTPLQCSRNTVCLGFVFFLFFFLYMMEFFSAWWAIWGITYVDFNQLRQLHENYVVFWKKQNGEFRLEPWRILELKANIYFEIWYPRSRINVYSKKRYFIYQDWRVG